MNQLSSKPRLSRCSERVESQNTRRTESETKLMDFFISRIIMTINQQSILRVVRDLFTFVSISLSLSLSLSILSRLASSRLSQLDSGSFESPPLFPSFSFKRTDISRVFLFFFFFFSFCFFFPFSKRRSTRGTKSHRASCAWSREQRELRWLSIFFFSFDRKRESLTACLCVDSWRIEQLAWWPSRNDHPLSHDDVENRRAYKISSECRNNGGYRNFWYTLAAGWCEIIGSFHLFFPFLRFFFTFLSRRSEFGGYERSESLYSIYRSRTGIEVVTIICLHRQNK